MLSMTAPDYGGKLEYSGPEFAGKLDGSFSHKGFIEAKGAVNGEYQVGNKPKHTVKIAAEQAFKMTGKDHFLKHLTSFEASSLPKIELQVVSDRKGDVMKNSLEMTCGPRKSQLHVDITRQPNDIFTAVATAKCDTWRLDHKADVTYQNKFPQKFMLVINAETPTIKDLSASVEYAMKVDPKWNLNAKARLAYPGKELLATKRIDENSPGRYKMETLIQWDKNAKIDVSSDVVFRPKEHEYTIESTAKVAGVTDPFHIKKHVRYHGDSYNLHWQARHGAAVVYELIGDSEGKFGNKQKFNVEVKSEKFEPKFNYQLVGNVEPSADSFACSAIAKKDGREVGRGDVTVPRVIRSPSQKYKADFSWTYLNNRHRAMAEYMRNKDARGSTHKLNVEGDGNHKMALQFDLLDKVTFKCDVSKDGRKFSSTEFRVGPTKWDHFELEGSVDTDEPLPRRSIKTRAAYTFKRDQMNAEASVESSGHRYLAEGKWKKQMEGPLRHYVYSAKLDTPHGGVMMEQQMRVADAFTVRKMQTEIDVNIAGKKYKLNSDMEKGPESLKSTHQITGEGLVLRESTDYTHVGGRRKLKRTWKYNEKEVNLDIETVYQDRELMVHSAVKTSFPRLSKIETKLGCKKESQYWNCEADMNVNDKYKVQGHEALTEKKTDVGYLIELQSLLSSEGKLEVIIDKRSSKYYANAQMRNSEKKYNFEMDITGEKGTLKLKTPTQALTDAKLQMVKKGNDEFEITSERNGAALGKVVVQLKTGDRDKLFKLQITEITEPFEVLLRNTIESSRQSSIAEFTLDPLRARKTYGIENLLESEGEKFRALKTTLKHPKRVAHIEVLRPATNKYALSVQPNMGSGRRPTVVEMTYDKSPSGYNWEGSISDEALKKPLKAKLKLVKSGDRNNYALNIQSEFDYSGQPDKLLSQSLRVDRNEVASTRGVKFNAEFKSTHPASNLHLRLWTTVERKLVNELLIPVRTNVGIEMKNAQRNLVEYSMDAETDAASFAEYRAIAPGKSVKARIDKANDKHYKMAFFKDSDKASLLGELKLSDKGAELEVRDDKSGDIKMHMSALMMNEYAAQLEMWHSTKGRKIRDARLGLRVDESNLLKANVYIRPAIEDDIMKTAEEAVSTAKNLDENALVKGSVLPMVESHKFIAKDIFETLNSLIRTWATEQKAFAAQLGPEYEKIVEHAEENFELLQESVLLAFDHSRQMMEQMSASLPRSQLIETLRQLKSGGGDLPKQIAATFQPVRELFEAFSKQVDKLQKQLLYGVNYLDEKMKLKELRVALKEYKRKFSETDVIATVLKEAKRLSREYNMGEVHSAISDLETNRKEYEAKALQFYNKLKDVVMDHFAVSGLSSVTEAILDPLSPDGVDDLEVRKKWQQVISFIRGDITSEELAERLVKKYIPAVHRKGPGDFEVVMAIPQGSSSLKELMEDIHPDRLIAIKGAIAEKLLASDHELHNAILDSIHVYAPTRGDGELLPPFKSIGYLVGPNHLITFDGRTLTFGANCDYLLAADLINLQFSLIAMYSSKGGKPVLSAIRAEVRDSEVILHRDGKVEVNGAAVSLPWQKIDSMDGAALVSVRRKGEWRILETYDGLKVKCHKGADICEVALPGRMHARSSGLLGRNDNEPANDHHLPDGTHNDNDNALAEHWAVRGTCRRNEAVQLQQRESAECSSLFKDSGSLFRPCFSQVVPTPFEKMCSVGSPKDLCTAASAYVRACSNVGVDVDLPEQCVACEESSEGTSSSAHDVVFVVEERSCMDGYRDKIARLGQKIVNDHREVKLGWVGFGGEGVHYKPSVHYDGESANLGGPSFSKQTHASFEPSSGIEKAPYCPLKAIKHAIEHFPFRRSSMKSIVLVQCRKCEARFSAQEELLDALLSRDITLHVLSLAKIKASDGTKAVGVSSEHLFNEAGAAVGDRSTLIHPVDSCSVVAQQSHGTVFNIKHGSAAAASKIGSPKRDHCVQCKCEGKRLNAMNVCRPCNEVTPAEVQSSPKVSDSVDTDEILLNAFL